MVIFQFPPVAKRTGDPRGRVVFRHAQVREIFNEMCETEYSRKLEKSGRLMIPIKLREEMGLVPGKEYQFFTCIDNGHRFICIDCGAEISTTLEQAMKIIQANGLKIVQNDD